MLESGLLGSGTGHYLLSDKNYSPVLMCHRIVFDSLEGLLLRRFIDKHEESKAFKNPPDIINEKGRLLHHERNPWNMDKVFNISWHTFWQYIRTMSHGSY